MNTIRHTIAKSPQWYDPGEHLRYRSLVRQTGTSHWRPQSVLLWIPGSAFTGVHRAFSYGFRERSLASTERSLMDTIRNHRDFHSHSKDVSRASACQSDLWRCSGRGQMYLFQQKMAKKQSKKNKETGKRKPRKSAAQKQKQREKEHERMTAFNKTKAEEQAFKDMTARETALKRLGIGDVFEFADHAEIYNSEHGKYSSAPIEVIDASVPPAPVTLHPERTQESSPTPEAHRQSIPDAKANFSFLKRIAAPKKMDSARARRTKAIFVAHCNK